MSSVAPAASAAPARFAVLEVLSEPSYRRLWLSGLFVNAARWMDLVVLGWLSEDDAIAVGEGLARAIERVGEEVLVVASSDLSHYLPDAEARRVDRLAIDALLTGDPGTLYRTVRERDISMCGVIPTTAMLAYARSAGGQPPSLVAYATSADASGDRSRVVGYAGVVL